jgi:hypothetical protein
MPLPCKLLCRELLEAFAVHGGFAVRRCGLARQSHLCRVEAHGGVWMHGNVRFSGSD